METGRSGAPRGHTSASAALLPKRWMEPAARTNPAPEPRPSKRAMHWFAYSADRAEPSPPVTSPSRVHASSVIQKDQPVETGRRRGAVSDRAPTCLAQWSRPARCCAGIAIGKVLPAGERRAASYVHARARPYRPCPANRWRRNLGTRLYPQSAQIDRCPRRSCRATLGIQRIGVRADLARRTASPKGIQAAP